MEMVSDREIYASTTALALTLGPAAEQVGHLSFFQKLSERKARRICRLLTLEMYEDGAQIFHVGDEADRVFVLGSGVIKAYTYSPGEPPPPPRSAPICVCCVLWRIII